MSRMFHFITKTCNPIGGKCPHDCVGCWARMLSEQRKMSKYQGGILLYEKELKRKFKEGDFVFIQNMSDLFADCVPSRIILRVLDWVREQPKTKFLFLTKNPRRYLRFCQDHEFSNNVVLGATIETNYYRFSINGEYIEYGKISKAPKPRDRLEVLMEIKAKYGYPVFISVEPILDFMLANNPICYNQHFAGLIRMCNPWAVAVGYDNYGNKLPEPSLEKTLVFIEKLEDYGIKIYRKTLHKAWWEPSEE